jgi:hypothetical protein
MKDPEDEAFEELALKQGHWVHTSGNRKRQIMEHEMNLPPKVPKAFPNAFWREDDGMDLRDYFAAHVAVGMMSEYWNGNHLQDPTFVDIAQQAYALADAMLKAREA